MSEQNHQENNFDQNNIFSNFRLFPINTITINEDNENDDSLHSINSSSNNFRIENGNFNFEFGCNEYDSTNHDSFPIRNNLIELYNVNSQNRLFGEFDNLLEEVEHEINIRFNNNLYKGKHTRKASYNAAKVVITRCKNVIHDYLIKQIRSYLYNTKKTEEFKNMRTILHIPTIYQYLNKGGIQKYTLFYTSMKSLYNSTIPRRVEDKIKNERNKYSYNKDTLTKILETEKNDDNIIDKKLNNLFEANFIIYLDAFLNDKNSITINGINYELDLEFVTFKDCFNKGKTAYTQEEKKEVKKYIYSIINKEMNFRKNGKKIDKCK